MKVHVFGVVGIISLFLSVGAVCAATESQSPSPSATAPDLATRAKDWLHRLQTGDIDRAQLTDKMNAALTPDTVKQISSKLGPLGDPQSVTSLGQQSVGDGMTAFVYRVAFKSTTINEVFVLDSDGKVAGIQFPPAQ